MKHWSGCVCEECAMEAGVHPSQQHEAPGSLRKTPPLVPATPYRDHDDWCPGCGYATNQCECEG